MKTTTNYALNIAEGTDKYNHLTVDNPNYNKIDTQMKNNELAGVTLAEHTKSGTVHTIKKENQSVPAFRFIARADYDIGDTIYLNDSSRTWILPNGNPLPDKAFVSGASVFCIVIGQTVTVYTSPRSDSVNATTLNGHPDTYFATQSDLTNVNRTANNAVTVANEAKAIADTATKLSYIQRRVELWRNPNSSDAFVVADNDIVTINIPNLQDYTQLYFTYKAYAGDETIIDTPVYWADAYTNTHSLYGNDTYYRFIKFYRNQNKAEIQGAYSASGVKNDATIVPQVIYGINIRQQ